MQNPPELNEYQTDHDLLIKTHTLMEVMSTKIDNLAGNFVTQAEFWPVKTLVYGCTALMLTSLVGAIIYLVLKTH